MFLFLRLKDMSGSFQKKLQYTELHTLPTYCALIKGTKCGSRLILFTMGFFKQSFISLHNKRRMVAIQKRRDFCSTWFSQSSIEILNVKHLVLKIIGNKLLTLLLFYCTSSSNIWLIPPLSWTSLKLALLWCAPTKY